MTRGSRRMVIALAASLGAVVATSAITCGGKICLPVAVSPRHDIRTPSAAFATPIRQVGAPATATCDPTSIATPTASEATSTVAPTWTAAPTATSSALPPVEPSATAVANGDTFIVLADPITVTGGGAAVSGSSVEIVPGGTFHATGALTNGSIVIDTTEKVKLILEGVSLTNQRGPAITVANAKKLALVLAAGSDNSLADGASYDDSELKGALFSNDTVEISGSGSLTIVGNRKHGIASDDDVVIEGGNLTYRPLWTASTPPTR